MDRIQDWNTSYITLQIPRTLRNLLDKQGSGQLQSYPGMMIGQIHNTADLLQIISFQNWPNIIYFKI